MHPNSLLLFTRYAKPMFERGMRVLEVGPNDVPSYYQQAVADETIRWETIDMHPSDRLTYVARTEYSFPIENNTFDIVFSGQVIEHVRKIWTWMRELSRVCKPGGLVITINPVNWPFHENPVDCWRIYPEGMKALHEEAGLTTTLALYDSLDFQPMAQPSAYCLVKQGLRRLVGKTAWLPHNIQPPVDAISIGRKVALSPSSPAGG